MKKILVVALLLIIGWVGYYGLSPLFKHVEVNDPLPDSLTAEERSAIQSGGGFENLSDETKKEMADEMDKLSLEGPLQHEDVLVSFGPADLAKVMGTAGHPAEGTARVLKLNGETVVRFENFKTINGPRLHIYLAKDLEAKEYIDLGPIRGTEGNINYTVPKGVRVEDYPYVLHWCVPFGVLFNFAKISG